MCLQNELRDKMQYPVKGGFLGFLPCVRGFLTFLLRERGFLMVFMPRIWFYISPKSFKGLEEWSFMNSLPSSTSYLPPPLPSATIM